MASAQTAQGESVLCLIVLTNKYAKKAFELPHNSKYVHFPYGDQQPEGPPTKRQRTTSESDTHIRRKILAVRLRRDHFRDPKQGLVFGSNDQLCDVLLDENTNAGISEIHFALAWKGENYSPRVMQLVNHSSKRTTVEDTVLVEPEATYPLAEGDVVSVRVGKCSLDLKIMPDHRSTDWTVYTEEWRKMYQGAKSPQAPRTPRKRFPGTHTVEEHGPEYRQRQIELREFVKLDPAVARGQFGDLYECYFKEDMSPFAMKTIKIGEFLRYVQLQREPEILRSLRHLHIVEYIDFVKTKKEVEIYMEWAAHGDLHDFRNHKSLEESMVIEIAQQVLKALIYLHNKTIIHRDLKPKNILVSSLTPFKVKLADFGLSKVLAGSPNILTSGLGTSGYMAPEILEHGSVLFNAMPSPGHTYNESVDIFALGATLLELLTGRNPFAGESSVIKLRHKIRILQPTCVDAYTSRPQIASALIMKMVAADPAHRPTATECLNHPWLASPQPGLSQLGPSQTGLSQLEPSQSGSSQFRSSQFEFSQSGSAQSRSSQSGLSAIALQPSVAPPILPAQNRQPNEQYRRHPVSRHGAAASIPLDAGSTIPHHSTQTSSSEESFDTLTASVIGRQYARNERHERRRTAQAGA